MYALRVLILLVLFGLNAAPVVAQSTAGEVDEYVTSPAHGQGFVDAAGAKNG